MIPPSASSSRRTTPDSSRIGMQPGTGLCWRFPARGRANHVTVLMLKAKDRHTRSRQFLTNTRASLVAIFLCSGIRLAAQTTLAAIPPLETARHLADEHRWQDIVA